MKVALSVAEIVDLIGADCLLEGDYQGSIHAISSLSEAETGDLSFLGNLKYRSDLAHSSASVILVPQDETSVAGPNQLFIRLKNPSFSLAIICRYIEKQLSPPPVAGIHATAVIEPGAEVSPDASIGPFCYVKAGAKIGSAAILESHVCVGKAAVVGPSTKLGPQVVLADYSQLGARNRISAGVVIGADGYGYEYHQGAHRRVPQIGYVVTGDDVDIGANSTIDRARFGITTIGQGTKIDNLVQIAHNVRIGAHCLIVAQVGISGSTVLEDGVVVGGQVGIVGHLNIGAGSQIAGASVVTHSLDANSKVRGYPAEPMLLFNRIAALQRKLPSLFKRFSQLERSLQADEHNSFKK